MQLIIEHADLSLKIADLKRYSFAALKKQMAVKVEKGDLTQSEMDILVGIERARWDAIQVDEFLFDAMKKKTFASVTGNFKNPMD